MRHSKQIKEQAVARMRAGDTPLLDLAREFDVSTNTLRTWLRASDARNKAQDSARRVATALSPEKYTSASQRQRLLMHALEQSPATIIVTDIEGKIVYANPKFVATTGYAIEEVIGQTPRILKSGETSSNEYHQLWKSILGGKEWRGTFHNRRKDGTLYWERASISPVLDAEGKITHFMAVKEDITEFMEADAARRKTAAGFHAVFAALPCAVLLVDGQGCVQMANAAAESLFDMVLPAGTQLSSLNLRWMNADGTALTGAGLPLARMAADSQEAADVRMRLGIVPPTGGVRWLNATARRLRLPESSDTAALLVLQPAE